MDIGREILYMKFLSMTIIMMKISFIVNLLISIFHVNYGKRYILL